MKLVGKHQKFGGHIGHGSGKQAPGMKGHQGKSVDGEEWGWRGGKKQQKQILFKNVMAKSIPLLS